MPENTIGKQEAQRREDKQFSLDMFALQQRVHRDNQEMTTKSNIDKAKHDAAMTISNNIK